MGTKRDKEAKARGEEGRLGMGDKRPPRATRRSPPRPTRPTTASGRGGRPHALRRQAEEGGRRRLADDAQPTRIGSLTGRCIPDGPTTWATPKSPPPGRCSSSPYAALLYVLCSVIVHKYLVQDEDAQRVQPATAHCFCPPGETLLKHYMTARGMRMRLLLHVTPQLHLCQ